ncbi:MAG: NAD(P)-binding protein [Bacteroidales bacterium]|nr:NAD(P)-binding protein [Bacteroidales bacterium]
MEKYKFLILGAGPSGLAFAHTLLKHGERSFLVMEKEDIAGGLCRSKMVDGSPLDIGGGHFLDTRLPHVLEFLFQFLPQDQWNIFDRKSAIDFGDYRVDYPIESNIWQLPVEKQVEYIHAIAYAGENLGHPAPEQFEDWIQWKLGKRIAEDYMFPYNRKIWSIPLEQLGTYWIDKLPSVSFKEVLYSCLTKEPYGKIPAHKTFYYPIKHGYGAVWELMGKELGEKLALSSPVQSLDIKRKTVNNHLSGAIIINTIPWNSIRLDDISSDIHNAVTGLQYSGIQVDYFSADPGNDDHWIYIPDERLSYHRILNRKTFIDKAKGYWTETNLKRSSETNAMVAVNNHAYPLNTREKPSLMKKIAEFTKMNNVYGLGRWGTWEHINSDIAVKQGIELAESLLKNMKK